MSSTDVLGPFNMAAMSQQVRDAKAEAARKEAHVPKKLLPWREKVCGGAHVAGMDKCFRQGGTWVCFCIKKPNANMQLLMIFVQQVSVTKLHLSEEKNKWDNFADSLIAKFPTQFGPPWSPISGATVQSRLNSCIAEVQQKHKIPAELESAEGGGTGSMYEDHQEITEYDLVVMKIDKDQKQEAKDKKDAKSKSDKVKNNCMHFEYGEGGVMPGLVKAESSSATQDFDTSFEN
jgi:hypothetical protein